MVWAMKDVFQSIISIELSYNLYLETKKRFTRLSHVNIIHGDSSKVLPSILAHLEEPCLFWLDAHGLETPIREEIRHILRHPKDHVVLVDDARLLTGEVGWPTIDQLKELVSRERPNWIFEVKDDIIRIHEICCEI